MPSLNNSEMFCFLSCTINSYSTSLTTTQLSIIFAPKVLWKKNFFYYIIFNKIMGNPTLRQ